MFWNEFIRILNHTQALERMLFVVEDILMALEAVSGRKHPSTVQVKQLKTCLPLMPVLRHFVTSPVNYEILLCCSYLICDLLWTDKAESLQRLWSNSRQCMVVPRMRLCTISDRSFRVMAARAWNSLPTSTTTATSLDSFKRQLKTFLFPKSFPELCFNSVSCPRKSFAHATLIFTFCYYRQTVADRFHVWQTRHAVEYLMCYSYCCPMLSWTWKCFWQLW